MQAALDGPSPPPTRPNNVNANADDANANDANTNNANANDANANAKRLHILGDWQAHFKMS